ncbi:Putative lipoprotein LppJ [Mycobacterium persicum]|uniref:Lipoprotein LppJ n=2 Tax=Mycobacterium persicum TaxID=1487726 RepID=A0AB38UQ74_9MYCO|nr:Putative lipoprotein LppJ [Mycobacterium persicum]VAZ82581.1 Putative lipoprotein LppJ [Mycobacterium persicum]VAZ89744.1 Putative lipoprotein LppJ [Mycobacterium persicum]
MIMFSMTNITTERQCVWLRQAMFAVTVVAVMVLGACSLVFPKPHSSGSSNPFDDSAHPMTDDQIKAQVIEPAKQIVTAANLQGVSGGFSFASCNDQGDPPYQGTVTITFLIHGEPDTYFQQVRAAMLSHGWNAGPPPGQHLHGTTLNKNGVTANISFLPSDHSYGQIILDGECRNTTDHRHDPGAGLDITNQLTAP